MAFRTFAFPRPRLELPFVGIIRMAIRALGKGQRFPKVAAIVAIGATNFHVHPKERVFCFRVVKLH